MPLTRAFFISSVSSTYACCSSRSCRRCVRGGEPPSTAARGASSAAAAGPSSRTAPSSLRAGTGGASQVGQCLVCRQRVCIQGRYSVCSSTEGSEEPCRGLAGRGGQRSGPAGSLGGESARRRERRRRRPAGRTANLAENLAHLRPHASNTAWNGGPEARAARDAARTRTACAALAVWPCRQVQLAPPGSVVRQGQAKGSDQRQRTP